MARHICDVHQVDVLFSQESWLSPDLLHKLRFIWEDYFMYGISAIESTVGANTLVGRPFGGLATLIHSKHKDLITNHVCFERYNIISIGNLVLINVYLPCTLRGDDLYLVDEMFDAIYLQLENITFTDIVFGGNINCNPANNSTSWKRLSNKISKLGVSHVTHLPNTCTFRQEKLNHSSCIDHFFISCSSDQTVHVDNITTIDCYMNFSDLVPVMLTLSGDFSRLFISSNIPIATNAKQFSIDHLNWNSADQIKYYELSRVALDPILYKLNQFDILHTSTYAEQGINATAINILYENITIALSVTAASSVPSHKKYARKFW